MRPHPGRDARTSFLSQSNAAHPDSPVSYTRRKGNRNFDRINGIRRIRKSKGGRRCIRRGAILSILRAFAASREIPYLWKRASREAAKAQRTRKPRGVETYGLSWEHRSRRFPNKPSRTLAPFFFGPKTSHATCQNRLHRRCREYCTPCDFRHSTVFLA